MNDKRIKFDISDTWKVLEADTLAKIVQKSNTLEKIVQRSKEKIAQISNKNIKQSEAFDLLSNVISKHYEEITDPSHVDEIAGAQMWNGKWWTPLWGCDTLSNMFDDLVYVMERKVAGNGA